MPVNELRLFYTPDDEWCGQLYAEVSSRDFAGHGAAWFGLSSLKDFAAQLGAFPLSPENFPLIESGFGNKEAPGTLDQCHLRIGVRPYNKRGWILVQVDLATEIWKTPDEDLGQSVTVRFLVEYSVLQKFSSSLKAMLDGNGNSAVLASLPLGERI